MSRSDRSRQGRERTAEDREHDREERERLRAARAGATPGDPHAPEPTGHSDEANPSASPPDAAPALAGEPDPEPHSPEAPAYEPHASRPEEPHAPHAPESLEPWPAEDTHGAAVHAPELSEALPAAELHTAESHAAESHAAQSRVPEPHASEPPAPLGPVPDPPLGDPPPQQAPAGDPAAAELPTSELSAVDAPAPAEVPPQPAAAPGEATASAGAETGAGEESGAPSESHAAAARVSGGRLPPPPPLPGRAGGSRALHVRRRPRSGPARIGAVVALLAAIAAIVLLVRSLSSTTHSKSPATIPVLKLVIPEGKTRAQIAEISAAAGLRGSYTIASRRSPLLDPTRYGAPAGTPDLEGFLFPATYDEYPGAPAGRLVSDQLTAFKENFTGALIARARALHVTPYQLLIVASMIEREAQVPTDRAKIAAVIYNRLHQEIPLGIDATIYYAVELAKHVATYTHELTEAQLHINSPYNTRTHVGLPPTPISNPGLASVEAAANPVHASYLYYVAGADGCGEQVFSSTLAAFESNVSAYQAAVAANGGHPPRCKKK